MAVAPANAREIQVNAKMWEWDFTYGNGHNNPRELHVPKGEPIQLVLNSADVIHSFFVPQFRIKKDVVPRRYNKVWFEATMTGTFDIYCAEYCGTNHSKMLAKVVVHEPDEFEQWLRSASVITGTPIEIGRKQFELRCSSCHRADEVAGIGPGWKNIFGYPRPLTGGGSVVADEAYLRESILYPGAKVVAGFPNQMPSFQGVLRDEYVDGLIAYIKSLSERGPKEAPATAPATQPATQPNQ
jgi:cytochrome c oxidase subunit 2